MTTTTTTTNPDTQPPTINFILSFLLVGLAWGFTTPFIRRAAKDRAEATAAAAAASASSPTKPYDGTTDDKNATAWWNRLGGLITRGAAAAVDLLRNPRYAVPLVLNLSGSVWFFLLVGKAELSLTVPIVNTVAFLFTVLGEWWVEGKVISRDTMLGMLLSVAGIALCVHSKNVS
ncbi:hypothetical protein VTJ49DRAFT_3873 [Mycothermus thermophilus]|uniref:Integral membrane protein n=1 Tax=Humicola insolens TaxID=85995 RepID=A0ABR3VR90_HUMIN